MGKFWDFFYQKQEMDFLAVLETLPDMDLTQKPKMHFLIINFGIFEQFVTNPHLETLQLVTIWRNTQSMSV